MNPILLDRHFASSSILSIAMPQVSEIGEGFIQPTEQLEDSSQSLMVSTTSPEQQPPSRALTVIKSNTKGSIEMVVPGVVAIAHPQDHHRVVILHIGVRVRFRQTNI